MQTRYAPLGLALAVGIAGGAVAFAQQRAEPVPVSPPRVAGAPAEPAAIPSYVEPAEPIGPLDPSGAFDPGVGAVKAEPAVADPTLALAVEPPPAAPEPAIPDVTAFLDEGTKTADAAIEALTAERDELRARLEKVEADLAKWKAVRGALISAKKADEASITNLEPLPEASSRRRDSE